MGKGADMWPFVRYPVKQRAIVNLKGRGPSFRGIVWNDRGGLLTLKQAEVIDGDNRPKPVDGEVLIPLENIEFLQILR